MNVIASRGGSRSVPPPQGHIPASARNSVVLPEAASPRIWMRSPGLISTRLWSSVTQTSGSASCKSSSSSLSDAESDDLDATRVRADRVDRREGIPKRHDAQKRGAPVGDLRQIIHEPAQGGLHLIEGTDHHHERAKAHIATEIARRRDHDRHHQRKPAIAGRDPGEAREGRLRGGSSWSPRRRPARREGGAHPPRHRAARCRRRAR